jgi:threonylcarbamoyladenosine tRNA methylthiotransferase CDKAL1
MSYTSPLVTVITSSNILTIFKPIYIAKVVSNRTLVPLSLDSERVLGSSNSSHIHYNRKDDITFITQILFSPIMEKIHLLSFGCSNNFHEGEAMAGLLEKAGYTITKDPYAAEIIILNLCTVKGDHQALRALKKTTKEYNAKIIAAGCILESTKSTLRELDPSLSLINTNNLDKIVEVVEAVIEGDVVEVLKPNKITKINIPKIRLNPIINIVPVGNGCTSACTYCSVKLIKGHVQSYSILQLVEEVKRSIKEGCKEIYLTGQDTGAYGLDWKTKDANAPELPELLDALTQIPGDFRIRVGMTSPNHVHRHLQRLITVMKHPKIYKFIHIPIQSGNNEVLKAMKRPNTVEQYKECIHAFKKAFPDITIATDIIVGFPGETDNAFQDTLNLIETTQPDVLNTSRFAPRPQTLAAKMKQVPTNIAKERSKALTKLFERIAAERNTIWSNWAGPILIDEYGKNNTMVGRNYAYKPVIVKGNHKLGDELEVSIKQTTTWDLRAFDASETNAPDDAQETVIQIRV